MNHPNTDPRATRTAAVASTVPQDEKVDVVMRRDVATCRATDSAKAAARIMWEQACGCVPIVDELQRPIAMLTDRDICMAAYIQGHALASIPISSVMSSRLFVALEGEPLRDAERRMRTHCVQRLPVVDGEGTIVGLLTLADIADAARGDSSPWEDGLSAEAVALTAAGTSHTLR